MRVWVLWFSPCCFYPYIFSALGEQCCARAFSSCCEQGCSVGVVRGISCGGFSCCRARLWGTQASVFVGYGLVALWHVESSWTRDRTCVPCIGRRFLYHWPPGKSQCFRMFLRCHMRLLWKLF